MNTSTDKAPIVVKELEEFCVAALMKAGLSETDARITVDVLVTTDKWGVHTHGTNLLNGYVQRLKKGGLNPRGVPKIVAEGPGWARIDGDSSIGMVTSCKAMQLAVDKARVCGMAYVGVFNTCHFGAAGYYANTAAQQNMFSMAMANDHPSMTIPGARGRIIGNNPLALAVPGKNGRPVILDMALSAVAGGKVMAAQKLGKTIPADWLVDKNGNTTTNPADFLGGGALLAMGGYKGYGLAVMVEALAGILPGASILGGVLPWIIETSKPTGHGAAFIALDIEKLMAPGEFHARLDDMSERLRTMRRSDADRVYLPGEREWERFDIVEREGLTLPDDVIQNLQAMSKEVGMNFNTLLR